MRFSLASHRWGFIASVSLVVGCMGGPPATNLVRLNSPPRMLHERDAASVTIITSAAPARPFVEVALIQGRRAWGTTESPEDIFRRLRAAAAKLGCDGLILLGEANVVSGMIWPTPGVNGPETWGTIETFEGFRATCIVWRDEGAAASSTTVQPGSGAP